jgi:hypothetical protein
MSAKPKLRSGGRIPRIGFELHAFELKNISGTELKGRVHIEIQVGRGKRLQIDISEPEESASRAQTHSVGWMQWAPVLFLQMNKSASQLNQPFEKLVPWALGSQPKMLKDIVCLIILLFVEADEIPFITGIMSRSDV